MSNTEDSGSTGISIIKPEPATPPLQDDHEWITAYLTIHQMSSPSYRYMYILWLVIVFILVTFAVFHGTGGRGGAFGGLWSKWSLRRRTWRKTHELAKTRQGLPHKQPLPLPSNAQLLSLFVLYTVTLLLCFLGPDYVAPGIHVWDLSSITPGAILPSIREGQIPSIAQPGYTISKAWWTAGGRAGTIAFALFPLCILFALKSPPFALFAVSFFTQIYNDKLTFLHRWTGRLIWFVTALHVACWGIQLGRDERGPDNPSSAWNFVFAYDKFVYGWLGFIALTLLVALSLRPVRVEFYELFYILHVILIPVTLAFSALHFPPIGWWCWGALILWAGERLWRFARFLKINGIVQGINGKRNARYISLVNAKVSGKKDSAASVNHAEQNMTRIFGHTRSGSTGSKGSKYPLISPTNVISMDADDRDRESDPRATPVGLRPLSVGQESFTTFATRSSAEFTTDTVPSGVINQSDFPPHTPFSDSVTSTIYSPLQLAPLQYPSRKVFIPPPGYAHAALLPGRTIRLRLIPPHHFTWAPGQHVLLTVPSVSKFSSHPFTIASICDSEAQSDERREIVILVRVRTGFTKDLWSHIEQLEEAGQVGDIPTTQFSPPSTGVLLRAYLEGPFGSSIRARWTSYSTVLIIAGGSGVSFAASILEYACLCMTGRNGKFLGGKMGHDTVSQISRIRFVWIIREYSHIQWVASVIRRCMDLVPTPALKIDIFVTNVIKRRPAAPLSSEMASSRGHGDSLIPPTPHFSQAGRSRGFSNASDISLNTAVSSNSIAEGITPPADNEHGKDVMDIVDMYGELGHEEHELDLTNFDGEDDTCLPGESQLSYRLRKEGKLRRRARTTSEWGLLTELPIDHSPLGTPLSATLQQGHVLQTPEHSEFTSSAVPPRVSLQSPASSGTAPNPFMDNSLHTWNGGESSHSLATPQSHKTFLYSASGDVWKPSSPIPSTKLDALTTFDSVTTKHPPRTARHSRRQSTFDINEEEVIDMPIVAELARPGRANIDRIVVDEVGRSRGATIVACCGPTSLNAMVRKSVAAHIDPSRILRGDERGSISLVSEDFEW